MGEFLSKFTNSNRTDIALFCLACIAGIIGFWAKKTPLFAVLSSAAIVLFLIFPILHICNNAQKRVAAYLLSVIFATGFCWAIWPSRHPASLNPHTASLEKEPSSASQSPSPGGRNTVENEHVTPIVDRAIALKTEESKRTTHTASSRELKAARKKSSVANVQDHQALEAKDTAQPNETNSSSPSQPQIRGSDNTIYTPMGPVPNIQGNGNTIVGPTDSHGNIILKEGTTIGANSCGCPTCVVIGANDGCGTKRDARDLSPPKTPTPNKPQ